jgi:hypothetical protein
LWVFDFNCVPILRLLHIYMAAPILKWQIQIYQKAKIIHLMSIVFGRFMLINFDLFVFFLFNYDICRINFKHFYRQELIFDGYLNY